MPRIRLPLISVLALSLFMVLPATTTPAADAAKVPPPSGTYELDPNHASITFKINHLGFSRYTGRFDKMEATLNLNSADPAQSGLDVTIYPNSIDTNNVKLEEELRGDKWFDVIKYPRATFQSTKIERTGPATARVEGDFTLMGVTHPIILSVAMIGDGKHPMNGKETIGFSATGLIHRSDYNLMNLLPMVGDDVLLEIEAEFEKTAE